MTVLSSRTLPLIRYELTDRVRLATRRCPCGRPFRLVEAVEGRTDDVLTLPAASGDGTVRIHPVLFHRFLDTVDVAGWQVRQGGDGLDVLLAAPRGGVDPTHIERALLRGLAAAGAFTPAVRVRVVDAVPAAAGGKRPLVVAARGPGTSADADGS